MKRVFVVGSTGTLGKEALNILKDNSEKAEIIGLTGFENTDLLCLQASELKVKVVGASKNILSNIEACLPEAKVFDIESELHNVLDELNPDITFFLSSGITALKGIQTVLSKGLTAAIANKESIIAGGEILFDKEKRKSVLPVDSETSAIFQCLIGEDIEQVEQVILTASGGPFYDLDSDSFTRITVSDALRHPNWVMGKKITVDSATLVNKAFEVIETSFLFGIPFDKISVIIHRESIIHSLIQFFDGQLKAVLSYPSMSFPIQYALGFPARLNNKLQRLDLPQISKLTFSHLDHERFKAFDVILKHAKRGGNLLPAIIGVDETVVGEFLNNKISFKDIPDILDLILSNIPYKKIASIDEVVEEYNIAIITAKQIMKEI